MSHMIALEKYSHPEVVEIKDRRRPYRANDASPYLIPLMRGQTILSDQAGDLRSDDFRAAAGIFIGAIILFSLWSLILLGAWLLFF